MPASVRRYFAEEKLIALPMSVVALAAVGFLGLARQADELAWGFTRAWSDPVFVLLAGGGFTLTIISVFAAIILLNPRENSYCVPLERSSSLLAGLAAAFVLHLFWNQPAPTGSELIGAALLLGAIVLLTLAPRFERVARGRALSQALSRAISRNPTSITFCAMSSPLARRRSTATASRPMRAPSTSTVVIVGRMSPAMARLPKPTTATWSGTRTPAACASMITPCASTSEPHTITSGGTGICGHMPPHQA